MRYFLHLGYDGSKYRGWQRQAQVKSIQETIEKHLTRIFKTKITVYGCGRTDAGVHASQYVAHINLKEALSFDLKFRLNKNLPDDIAVYEVLPVKLNQHARFDAVARTYDYFIHFTHDPVLNNYSTLYELDPSELEELDFKSMKQAVVLLASGNAEKDFRRFCKQPDVHQHTFCTVEHAELSITTKNNRMYFTMTANRFLRGMMRIIVTSLMKIGLGELSLVDFNAMLHNQGAEKEQNPAHPNGLFLSGVRYPYLLLQEQEHLCSLLKKGYS